MKKTLSFFEMFALGFGSIVGVGWSSTLNNLFKLGGGPIPAALSFLLAALLFVPVAMSIKSLAIQLPLPGGGWFITLSYMAILPFEAIAATDMIGYMFPALRSGAPLYTVAGEGIYLPAAMAGILCTGCIAAVNWQGVRAGVKFQKMTAGVLLVCVLFALLKADPQNLLDPVYAPVEGYAHTSLPLGVLSLLSVAPQYFAGFDTIQQNAEFSDRRYLGRAILGALLSAGLFYLVVLIAAGLAYPWQKTAFMARPVLANVFLKAYPGALGKALWCVCMLATLAGLFGAWNGFFIASVRSLQGMARTGLLPAVFCKTAPNQNTPALPFFICVAAIVAGIFLGAGALDIVCKLASIGFIVAWAISCLASYRIGRCPALAIHPEGAVSCGTAIGAILVCACIFANSGMIFLVGWTGVGLICYTASCCKKK